MARAADDLHVGGIEPDLLPELAKQRLLERLAAADAALGKLPAAAAGAPPQEQLDRHRRISTMPMLARKPSRSMTSFMRSFLLRGPAAQVLAQAACDD